MAAVLARAVHRRLPPSPPIGAGVVGVPLRGGKGDICRMKNYILCFSIDAAAAADIAAAERFKEWKVGVDCGGGTATLARLGGEGMYQGHANSQGKNAGGDSGEGGGGRRKEGREDCAAADMSRPAGRTWCFVLRCSLRPPVPPLTALRYA